MDSLLFIAKQMMHLVLIFLILCFRFFFKIQWTLQYCHPRQLPHDASCLVLCSIWWVFTVLLLVVTVAAESVRPTSFGCLKPVLNLATHLQTDLILTIPIDITELTMNICYLKTKLRPIFYRGPYFKCSVALFSCHFEWCNIKSTCQCGFSKYLHGFQAKKVKWHYILNTPCHSYKD